MTQMTKRIPVSEDCWKMLGRLKEAGQTYDDLMRELVQSYHRKELAASAKKARKDKTFSHEDVFDV
jgi:predicted CopG family antitoxin